MAGQAAGGTKRRLKVAVLMGGRSTEREISLLTGKMVLDALDPAKYEALAVDAAALGRLPSAAPPALADGPLPGGIEPPKDLAAGAPAVMAPEGDPRRPDVAFIALHGRFGEDGTVQGLLELLDIPYTGSRVLASAAAMSKQMSKRVFAAEGIPTPPGVALTGEAEGQRFLAAWQNGTAGIGVPCVVKPDEQGSTIGITIVRGTEEMAAALGLAFKYDETVLIEQFVEGVEITAALLGNRDPQVLPLVEIVPKGGFYDYERKYTPGATDEIVPARIAEADADTARELAVRCHRAFGCRGMSRVDMIVSRDGIWVLEINTIPGMTPTSLLPRAAAAAGITFSQLVDRLIALALEERDDPAFERSGVPGSGCAGVRESKETDLPPSKHQDPNAPTPEVAH
jgi:D-alanine-D-alanine ligase